LLALPVAPDEDVAAALFGTHFNPADVVAIEGWLTKAD
jgi:hypothetical protein